MKLRLILVVFASFCSSSHAGSVDYVVAADRLLEAELPKMKLAVEVKDRAYFVSALDRVKVFVNDHWNDLDKFPACTEAVSDFLIVGQCQIAPPGSLCEPETFFPKFEDNLAKCRAAAKANDKIQ